MKKNHLTITTFLASLFGIGFIPKAPGTFGTLFGMALYLLVIPLLGSQSANIVYGVGLLVLTVTAIWLSTQAEKKLGHDAPQIVIDELCGYLLALLFVPVHTWQVAIYAFVLFRVFDIAKPWPINISQRLPRGWGIVVDDLIAGIYTNLIIQIMIKIAPKFFGA